MMLWASGKVLEILFLETKIKDKEDSMSANKRYYNDIALKLIHKLFGLKYLHYGYFGGNQEVSLSSLPRAQIEFKDQIIGCFPEDVKKVLDVGCGTGETAKFLLDLDFNVTCVDPDPYLVKKTLITTDHRARVLKGNYETFTDLHKESFDLILMSESCQYINPDLGWVQHKKHLCQGGYVVIADFFKIKKVDKPYLSKSGHNFEEFLNVSEKNGFSLVKKTDITKNVSPTMDIYQDIIFTKVFPCFEAFCEIVHRRFPKIYGLLRFFLRKKIEFLRLKYSHQDSKIFSEYKSYFILVFKKI